MKHHYIIGKLFFFNLFSLLWWPYFCDTRQNGETSKVIKKDRDFKDSNKIVDVPSQEKETVQQDQLYIDDVLKEIVQSNVEFVYSDIEIEAMKNKEKMFNDMLQRSFEVEASSPKDQVKKNHVPSEQNGKDTHVNSNIQKTASVIKDPSVDIPENITEDSTMKLQVSLQPEQIPVITVGETETKKQTEPEEIISKPLSPDSPPSTIDASPLSNVAPAIDVNSVVDMSHHHSHYDGMPSFDEWKKMMLAEQEKGGQQMPSPGPPGKKISSQKRKRNYSSYECGAKIVASNSEAEGTSHILNELVDEYMLNPCKAKIWFIIELCETVQTSQIELANFELFSSCPKEFIVYSSDNFPTRDWVVLGTFTAAEQRGLQSFELKQEGFSVPSSSIRQSLFRHLHRCDQCISSNHGYYSSAQPHCRFFQAAFGSVLFKALCEWFREHPVTIAHAASPVASHSIDSEKMGSNFVIPPTKSPPPQIIRLPLDSDAPIKPAPVNNSARSNLSKSPISLTVDISNISVSNKTSSDADVIKLQPSIQPTKAIASDKIVDHNNSTIILSIRQSTMVVTSPTFTQEAATEVVETSPVVEKTETAGATENENEVLVKNGDTEEQQIRDAINSGAFAQEDLTTVEATEPPSGLKTDEKIPDPQGKLEPVPSSGITSASQKESVFIRMSNRIKALEVNMSLSGQYLQELSQRYRRQMEDMQRTFNRTIGTLNDTARKAAEKDMKQQEVINNLQLQVSNLTETVGLLLQERTSMFRQMIETHLCLMVIEAIVMITIMSLCVRRISSSPHVATTTGNEVTMTPSRCVSKRRNSADSSTPPIARKVKKRSCSEEELVAEQNASNTGPIPVLVKPVQKVKKKNRKRKGNVQRSVLPAQNLPPQNLAQAVLINQQNTSPPEPPPDLVEPKESFTCENCIIENLSGRVSPKTNEDKSPKRTHTNPLQNLTNGKIGDLSPTLSQKKRFSATKQKFSFKKLLKFQKRDSI